MSYLVEVVNVLLAVGAVVFAVVAGFYARRARQAAQRAKLALARVGVRPGAGGPAATSGPGSSGPRPLAPALISELAERLHMWAHTTAETAAPATGRSAGCDDCLRLAHAIAPTIARWIREGGPA